MRSKRVGDLQAEGILRVEDGNHGEYRPRRDEFSADGTAFIRATNVVDGTVDFKGADRITPSALNRIRKGIGRPRDILLTHKGTVGRVARVPGDAPPFVCSPQTTYWRVLDERQIDRAYLFAYLRSPSFVQQLYARMHGSDMAPYVSLTEQKTLSLDLPPIDQQQAIGRVLSSFDDKIENNQRLAKTVEEIATALFRAWFVEFTGHDDLVESEIGLVPRGWSIGGLSEVATVTMGQSPPSSTYTPDSAAGVLMVQGKGAFGQRFPKREVFCMEPRRLADAGDLLMTVRAPVGDLNVCTEKTCLGRGVAGISSPNPGFVEFALRAGASRWRAHESGTIYSAVNKQQVEGFPVVIPPSTVLEQFELIVAPMRDKIALCHQEIGTLSELRDQLLPRLLSGSLHVDNKYGDAP
jgi:type I restriction enzyme, S subunit